jgi:hypothetical protein
MLYREYFIYRLGQTTKNSENDTKIAQIFEQINTMTPDSQQR